MGPIGRDTLFLTLDLYAVCSEHVAQAEKFGLDSGDARFEFRYRYPSMLAEISRVFPLHITDVIVA
jgi:hypothetical protein